MSKEHSNEHSNENSWIWFSRNLKLDSRVFIGLCSTSDGHKIYHEWRFYPFHYYKSWLIRPASDNDVCDNVFWSWLDWLWCYYELRMNARYITQTMNKWRGLLMALLWYEDECMQYDSYNELMTGLIDGVIMNWGWIEDEYTHYNLYHEWLRLLMASLWIEDECKWSRGGEFSLTILFPERRSSGWFCWLYSPIVLHWPSTRRIPTKTQTESIWLWWVLRDL